MSSENGKSTIFPQARATIAQARGGEWSPEKRDTHGELTLSEMRFIRYIDSEKTIFEVSDMGNEFLESFELIKTPVEGGKFTLSLRDRVPLFQKNQLLFDILTRIVVVQPKYGRNIRPYMVLFKLLVDNSFYGYITKSEWAYFINNSDFLLDSQYEEIKKQLLRVRKYQEVIDPQKSDRILTRLVLWNVLDRHPKLQNAFCFNDSFFETLANNLYISGEVANPHNASISKIENMRPIQIIFYGAPGGGKSRSVKTILEEKSVPDKCKFRTTFHPDYDYASFVGTFKPSMSQDEEPKIVYTYEPQIFTKAYVAAWNDLDTDIYIVIEEINRGNCAQIFGDLFQLLDRDQDTGYSEYPIEADSALANYLRTSVDEEGNPILKNKDGIKDNKLSLPPNLHFYATMNTSDQSLFPMDSAFKRRWDWEYVPIMEDEVSRTYKIQIGNLEYDWGKFMIEANKKIKAATESEDKQMGSHFIRKTVDAKEFVSKVLFYLWSDVFKLEYHTNNKNYLLKYKPVGADKTEEFTFNDVYNEDGTLKIDLLQSFMAELGLTGIEIQPSTSNTGDGMVSGNEQTADIIEQSETPVQEEETPTRNITGIDLFSQFDDPSKGNN